MGLATWDWQRGTGNVGLATWDWPAPDGIFRRKNAFSVLCIQASERAKDVFRRRRLLSVYEVQIAHAGDEHDTASNGARPHIAKPTNGRNVQFVGSPEYPSDGQP